MDNIRIIKNTIEELLNNSMLDEAKAYIDELYSLKPIDLDVMSYYCVYYSIESDYSNALHWSKKAVRQYPTSADAYYNLASIYEIVGDIYNAIISYEKASYMYIYEKNGKECEYGIETKLINLWKELEKEYINSRSDELLVKIETLLDRRNTCYGMADITYRELEPVVGTYVYGGKQRKLFAGVYRINNKEAIKQESLNTIQNKIEFLEVSEKKMSEVGDENHKYLVPIACEKPNTVHRFIGRNKEYTVIQKMSQHFNYFCIDQTYKIESSDVSYYGRPIKLGHDENRKKLVLNIFVDGLPYGFVDDNSMPYTVSFFEKGCICNKAYSTAEWTYPSLATYNTGLYTTEHMMFHDVLDVELPNDVTTLAEYFEQAGYYTAKLDGEWRSTPNYGYNRGYRQNIYQNQLNGSKCEQIIGEAIDHIEAFKDTDQFLWICIGDLHDIADGYDLMTAVQNRLDLEDRTPDSEGITSVKQEYSEKKKKAMIETMKHLDNLLVALYSYVERNYSDDEIVVSLFADHGQGYLVRKDEHFMADGRSNVAFMFRGAGLDLGYSDELISTCDYIPIMCKLAGIKLKDDETISGLLPVCFGGDKGNEYVVSESIHPRDPYQAIFRTKDMCAYVNNYSPVQNDGRFELSNFKMFLEDYHGNQIDNRELYDKVYKSVMKHISCLVI